MSQNDPKTTLLMTSFTKNLQPPTKKFAIEQLSSAIGGGAMALVKQLKTAVFRPKSRYEYIVRWLSKC